MTWLQPQRGGFRTKLLPRIISSGSLHWAHHLGLRDIANAALRAKDTVGNKQGSLCMNQGESALYVRNYSITGLFEKLRDVAVTLAAMRGI